MGLLRQEGFRLSQQTFLAMPTNWWCSLTLDLGLRVHRADKIYLTREKGYLDIKKNILHKTPITDGLDLSTALQFKSSVGGYI